MANVTEMNAGNFQELLESNGTLIVDWWATWCGPCRTFGPVFEKVAANHQDIVFAKVNTEEEQELSQAFNIRSIPTLMVFREKVLLFSQAGALPESSLEDLVRQVRAIDMAAVHQEIEAEAAKKSGEPPAE